MDLYDGLGVETSSTLPIKTSPIAFDTPPVIPKETQSLTPPAAKKDEGNNSKTTPSWSSNFQLMASQLQRKKAERGRGARGRGRGHSASVVQPKSTLLPTIQSELPKVADDLAGEIEDEYDPLVPNIYDEIKAEEKRKREEEREKSRRSRELKRRHHSSDSEEEEERERERERRKKQQSRKKTSAIPPPMFAPPPPPAEEDKGEEPQPDTNSGNEVIKSALQQLSQIKAPKVNPYGKSSFKTSTIASGIMSKYGWQEGQGLGKESQGISTALSVQKTSFRGGKIVDLSAEREKEKEEEKKKVQSVMPLLKNPSKVVLLKNMVGPGEVDDDLQPEVVEECSKYGEVKQCLIYEIPHGATDDEAVRIFVQFSKVDSAIKAVIDLNGRYFGGRTVSGTFYSEERFEKFDLAPE